MASLSRTLADTVKDHTLAAPRLRFGRPRRRPTARFERNEHNISNSRGSHMPLDTDIHWEWSNPLNILPALVLLVVVVAVVALVLA